MSQPLRGLYAITDSALLAEGRLLPYVEAALKGGARLVQYRDKSTDSARRLHDAQALQEICGRYAAHFIINDDTNLAARLQADLHLGQKDGSLPAARAQLGPQRIIGATCHAQLELAEQAVKDGASYLAFGRFFTSHTKPDALAANLELLNQARGRFTLPLVAIGGVTCANAGELVQRGADMLAVIHELFAVNSVAEVERRAHTLAEYFA